MKQETDSNSKNHEAGEERLAVLIKEAGNEVRTRKREALACHFRKLQAAINEVVSQQQGAE